MRTITILSVLLTAILLMGACAPPETVTTPPAPAPASFQISNLTVTPQEVKVGEQVTITAEVNNTGGTEGSCTVELKINDATERKETVSVPPQSSSMVTFIISRDNVGTYEISLDGMSQQLNVKPNIALPAGKGAFYGRVMWGDKPVVNGTVIADTKPPVVVVPPWESYSAKYKKFTVNTDNEGNYVLIVEPDKYYIGCTLPDSDYITYTSFGSYGLFGVFSQEITIGHFVLADFEVVDWSIKLISPGSPESISHPPLPSETVVTVNSTPTLLWQGYDWQRYSTEQNYCGYYKIIIKLYSNEKGYYTVEEGTSNNTSYNIINPLSKGEYYWKVQAYTKSGKEIAGTEREFYFVVP